MGSKNIIEVNNICKRFKNTEVLKGISLRCESGKIYGIVGHNGSGKTVLLKCICGFLKAEKGSILVNGKEMGKQIDMLTNAGIIIEEPAFLRNWSAYQNLNFLYMIRNKKNRKHIYEILEKVGLEPKLRRPVGKFSLGMKQRLAIAQAIMEQPDILILDEPMNGLDKKGMAEMRELFLEMKNQGKLILFASHNKDDIDILCDEVYELEEGEINNYRNFKIQSLE